MSYDIYLYEKRFLRRAVDEDLGDWRNADPISDDKLSLIRELLKSKGYITHDDTEFEFPNSNWGLQVSVFKGEVAFGIPFWDDVDAAIEKRGRMRWNWRRRQTWGSMTHKPMKLLPSWLLHK
jgi:hypothetical protein